MNEENQVSEEKPRIPGWAWVFVVGCVLIPIVALGGAIQFRFSSGSQTAHGRPAGPLCHTL